MTGCATQESNVGASISAGEPFEVLVLPPSTPEQALRHVLHNRKEVISSASLAADRERIDQALETALHDVHLRAVLIGPERVGIGEPIDPDTLSKLRARGFTGPYLRLCVSDYGETPRRWKAVYIGFEVVSTLAIAGALALHRTTRAVAGAYVLEEGVEELSEGYAGFWLLNRLSRPVRIEADLVDGRSGLVLRHTAYTGLARWRWRNVWHMDQARRDELLTESLRKAVWAVTGQWRQARGVQ